MAASVSRPWCTCLSRNSRTAKDQHFSVGGRMLGGGGSVNGMIYIRGDRADYAQ